MDFNNCKWTETKQTDFEKLPKTYGVYLITCETNSGKVVIYTGKTKDIHKRALDHWSQSEPNKMLKNIINNFPNYISYWWTEIDGRYYEGIEHFLRDYFKPQTQERAPTADVKTINVPLEVKSGHILEKYFE